MRCDPAQGNTTPQCKSITGNPIQYGVRQQYGVRYMQYMRHAADCSKTQHCPAQHSIELHHTILQ